MSRQHYCICILGFVASSCCTLAAAQSQQVTEVSEQCDIDLVSRPGASMIQLRDRAAATDRTDADPAAIQQSIDEMKGKMDSLAADVDQLPTAIESASEKVISTQTQVSALSSTVASLKLSNSSTLAHLSATESSLVHALDLLAALKNLNASAEHRLETLEHQVGESATSATSLESAATEHEGALKDAVEPEVQALEKTLRELKDANITMEAKISATEANLYELRQALDAALGNNGTHRNRSESLETKVEKLLNELKSRAESLASAHEVLDGKIASIETWMKAGPPEFESRLTSMENSLKDVLGG